MTVRAIVLAAGKGTRMKCDLSKVLHTVAGRPIVNWVVGAIQEAGIADITVVIPPDSDAVAAALPAGVRSVVQQDRGGTGTTRSSRRSAISDQVLVIVAIPALHGGTIAAWGASR
jgi:bifunctional UDP-N-acetylglucosamine pyrophosphorylase/glucosamine-1-phosphate N-acetyltransferase